MSTSSRMTRRAVVGGLVLLCLPAVVRAQSAAQLPAGRRTSPRPRAGSHSGRRPGRARARRSPARRFRARRLHRVCRQRSRRPLRVAARSSPGPYLLRAHLAGFVALARRRWSRCGRARAPRRRLRCGTRHATRSRSPPDRCSRPASDRRRRAGVGAGRRPGRRRRPSAATGNDDHSEIAWRLRHARRSDSEGRHVPEEMLADADAPPDGGRSAPATLLGARRRIAGAPRHELFRRRRRSPVRSTC